MLILYICYFFWCDYTKEKGITKKLKKKRKKKHGRTGIRTQAFKDQNYTSKALTTRPRLLYINTRQNVILEVCIDLKKNTNSTFPYPTPPNVKFKHTDKCIFSYILRGQWVVSPNVPHKKVLHHKLTIFEWFWGLP